MTILDSSHARASLQRVLISSGVMAITLVIAIKCNAQATAVSPSVASTGRPAGGALSEDTLTKSKNEFGLWAGGSLGLPSALGGSRDLKIPFILGLRYGRVLLASEYAALEYTIDLVPVAVVSAPHGGFSNPGGAASPGAGRDYAYGIGAIPVGFKLFVAHQHRVKPYLTVSSGPLYFNKQVPVPDSAKFNFLSTAGGGVQIFVSSRRALTVEYVVGHLSNAGVGNLNPGFNSSTFHFGFSVFR